MYQAYLNEIQAKDTSVGTMYDLVFSDSNRVGVGKFQPKNAEVGEYYSYDIVMKGQYKNLKPGSLSKLDKPAGVTPPSAKPGFVPSGDKRQETISKQAALNSALAFTTLLASQDALPIPAKVKASEKADLIQEVVDHYTSLFYEQATGQRMEIAPKPQSGSGGAASAMEAAESGDNWEE